MTTNIRTCANCCAFNPAPVDDEPTCWNLVSFTHHHAADAEPQPTAHDPGPSDVCSDHMTHEEDASEEAHQAEVARHVADSSPEFLVAMNHCLKLRDELGFEHPETTKAVQLAIALAPNSLHASVATREYEHGLLPNADGYTDDGNAVFSLATIAENLDLSLEDAQAAMDDMAEELESLGMPQVLIDPATVHRKQ